jgi:hypothetical protein
MQILFVLFSDQIVVVVLAFFFLRLLSRQQEIKQMIIHGII